MLNDCIDRLIGEKIALNETLFEEGRRDGFAYGKSAPYRKLKLIDKMVEAYGSDFAYAEINAVMLACKVCEVDRPDCDTRNWLETNLSASWQDEEEYIRGFISAATDIVDAVKTIESKRS